MIQITQGELNNVVATCSRNKQLTGNVTYLWSITHKLTKQNWKFIPFLLPSDSIGYAPSYDLFQINTDFTEPELFIATGYTKPTNLHLIPGQYFVKIYEQTSNSNLNPSQSFDVVYEGMANVLGPNAPYEEIVSYSGNTGQVFKVYDSNVQIPPSPTPSSSISPTPTPTPSISVSPSVTPSVTPSVSISTTPGLSPTPTPTTTPSISVSPSVTPSVSVSTTPTPTPSTTPTIFLMQARYRRETIYNNGGNRTLHAEGMSACIDTCCVNPTDSSTTNTTTATVYTSPLSCNSTTNSVDFTRTIRRSGGSTGTYRIDYSTVNIRITSSSGSIVASNTVNYSPSLTVGTSGTQNTVSVNYDFLPGQNYFIEFVDGIRVD
jgi:hypothetical protein